MPTTENLLDEVKKHEPYVYSYDCETCGPHQDWSCDCGWKAEMVSASTWMEHLITALRLTLT